jgi:hypothetical protein
VELRYLMLRPVPALLRPDVVAIGLLLEFTIWNSLRPLSQDIGWAPRRDSVAAGEAHE